MADRTYNTEITIYFSAGKKDPRISALFCKYPFHKYIWEILWNFTPWFCYSMVLPQSHSFLHEKHS